MIILESDLRVMKTAVQMIQRGECTRVDLGHGMVVYREQSSVPGEYIIRFDITIVEGDLC